MKELIKKFKELDIIHSEKINLKYGGESSYYIDVKKTYGYPEVISTIAEELYKKIGADVTAVAAAGYGGIPLASVIAEKYKLKLILVRDEPKKHGKIKFIDGYVPNNEDKIVIVDDVFTTGGSLRKIIEVLRMTEAEILGSYVVVKRGKEKFEFPLDYLLTDEDLFS